MVNGHSCCKSKTIDATEEKLYVDKRVLSLLQDQNISLEKHINDKELLHFEITEMYSFKRGGD